MVSVYQFEAADLRLLQAACESWDRKEQARAVIDKLGTSYVDRFGAPRLRPEVAVERDSRLAFVRIVRELDIPESDVPAED
jgi:hypothetical protein